MVTLFEMSLTGGILILIVLLLRAILLNRLPKTAFIVMWAVVLVRLLVPVSFFGMTTEIVAEAAEVSTVEAITPTAETEVREVITLDSYNSASQSATIAETAERASIFRTIWLAGAVICAIVLAVSYVISVRRFNKSENLESDFISAFQSSNKLRRTVTVKLSDETTTPLTYGIIHPVILLPMGMDLSDQKQLKYVLMHEYIHIRKLDNLLKGISSAAVCIHWFNPLVWVMNRFLSRDIELRCDEALLRQCHGDCRADYALTLIDLEDKRRGFATAGTAFAMKASEERIVAIMKFKPASVFKIIIASVLIGVMVTVAFAAPFGSSSVTTVPDNVDDYTILEMDEDGVCYVQLTASEEYDGVYYTENIAFSGTVIFTDENGEPFFYEFDVNDVGGIDFYLDDASKTVGGEEYGTIIDGIWSEPLVREYHDDVDLSMTYAAFGMEVEYDEDTYCSYYFTTDELIYLEKVEVSSTRRLCTGGESCMKYVLDGVEYDDANSASGLIEGFKLEDANGNFSLGNSAIIEFSEGLTENLKAGDIVHITVTFDQDENDDVRWAVYEYKKDGDEYPYSPDGVLKTPYATEIHRMSDVDVTIEITEDGDYQFALTNGSENGEYLNIVSATIEVIKN